MEGKRRRSRGIGIGGMRRGRRREEETRKEENEEGEEGISSETIFLLRTVPPYYPEPGSAIPSPVSP